MMVDAFLPSNVGTCLISVGAAASALRLPVGPPVLGNTVMRSGGEFLEVQNQGSVWVYLETSPGDTRGGVETPQVTAVVPVAGGAFGGYPIGPGQAKVIRRAQGDTHISIIGAAAGPTIVAISVGNGL